MPRRRARRRPGVVAPSGTGRPRKSASKRQGSAKAAAPKPPGKPRDADATRARVLAAAVAEFAAKGLMGARVAEIADRADVNKRMLYHYFGSKEDLFQAVVETVYLQIWEAEAALELDLFPPDEALRRLVSFTWDYYLAHPEFITLLNSENLNEARYFGRSEIIEADARQSNDLVQKILERGVAAGMFRRSIDPIQLNITISAVGYYYLTNRHTASIVYKRDMMSPDALAARLAFNIESILAMVLV
ncbi:TetR family transcriptional regulator [Kaistia algarum]|uniref:TetR/AcrR family transcriptional regulator n=1 Tax=Kaistia algarum TaxID=2083279 RepID=UPI000CE88194|nr:TetR/AcrR family transcriptional regulator [Kaistia algarum]MCX5512816.1 TetR/AcrR family transcriptional regulator [Kaistia algarum]PPE81689.1 TetR family transcriptional regulator [Kaistia algarum]